MKFGDGDFGGRGGGECRWDWVGFIMEMYKTFKTKTLKKSNFRTTSASRSFDTLSSEAN